MKGNKINYLDHGYVQLLDCMGDDVSVVQAARQSFGSEDYKDEKRNRGLINYLVEHHHSSPIEMPVLRFKLKMPIFVARQHLRHRTASLNEYSLRYSEQQGDYYLPSLDRFCLKDKWNHQGSGEPLPEKDAQIAQDALRDTFEHEWATYKFLLDLGVSNEIARCALGVNFYTEMVWQCNLRNLFHYLKLRNDPHAQYEIQQMAGAMEQIVAELFPMCYSAYQEYVKHSVTFSKTEMEILREAMSENISDDLIEDINGSARRAEAFKKKLSDP